MTTYQCLSLSTIAATSFAITGSSAATLARNSPLIASKSIASHAYRVRARSSRPLSVATISGGNASAPLLSAIVLSNFAVTSAYGFGHLALERSAAGSA